MQWKGTNIFVTNIPKPSNKIHSPLTLGLTLLSSDSNVRREGRPLNCYLQPSSSYKGVLDCLHDLTAISTLRVKTWQNHKPVCHMSTSPEPKNRPPSRANAIARSRLFPAVMCFRRFALHLPARYGFFSWGKVSRFLHHDSVRATALRTRA